MKRIFVLYVVLSICAAAFSQIKFPEIKWKSDSLIFIVSIYNRLLLNIL